MKLIHLRNNQVVDDAAKQPSADSLEYGEIAINYKKDKELLFIKNDQDEIVSFLTKDAVIELISTLETNLNSEISYLKNLSLPYVLVSGTGYMNIDGNTIAFKNANKQLIYITGPLCFNVGDSHASNGDCNYIRIPHLDSRTQGDSMRSMFSGCYSITSLDLSGFETSLVTDMSYMFNNCDKLTSLDLSSFDTSSVTNMSNMFDYCSGLTSIDLSSFDTSAVTNMYRMFSDCSGLTSLDLSSFDTSAVTNMSSMFYYCSNLTSIDLSSFNTSAVTDMSYMFNYCDKLASLDLSSFDTSSVTNMRYMFYRCSGLTSLDLSSFDTSSVTNMFCMFDYSSKLTSLDLSSFDTSSVTNMKYMFDGCTSLASLDLSSFDTSSVTDMRYMFNGCTSLASLILGPNFFKASKVTSVDFSSSKKWTNDTVVTSLVTNSYDRATAGLNTMTLQLSTNTKAALTDEQKATITAKGYTIA